jgi:hypothetical protein
MSTVHGRGTEPGSEEPLPSGQAAHDSSDAVAEQPVQLSRYEPTGQEEFAHPASALPESPLGVLVLGPLLLPELLDEPPPASDAVPESAFPPISAPWPEHARRVTESAARTA